jgi:hypothetical protein
MLLAAAQVSQLWYALPLILSVSLVYGATRHEELVPILQHSWRAGAWIGGFMVTIFLVLFLLGWWFI